MKFAEGESLYEFGTLTLRVPALFIIIFLFFPIPELSVSSVDRHAPKNDGRG
jgi:hypothetical protein